MSELLDILRRVASRELSPEQAADLIRPTEPVRTPEEVIGERFKRPQDDDHPQDFQAFVEWGLKQRRHHAVYNALRIPHVAESIRLDVTGLLLNNNPLPAPLAEWVMFQLYQPREQGGKTHPALYVPYRKTGREAGLDKINRLEQFIRFWERTRLAGWTYEASVDSAAREFKVSIETIKLWLKDPRLREVLRRRNPDWFSEDG